MDRFWSKAAIGDGCWGWLASRTTNGYGQFNFQGSMKRAHRVAYELERGIPPGDKFVCHHCDNRLCVRPSHLFLGTRQDNMDDMTCKGRSPRGERNGNARITDVQAAEILASSDAVPVLMARYGVAERTVYNVKSRNRWRHLERAEGKTND